MASLINSISTDTGLENNLDLLQQVALQRYVNNGEDSKPFYNLVTNLRIGNEVFQRLSGKRRIQRLKIECVRNITEFIKNNPKASQKEIETVVHTQVAIFATKLKR